ncbi:thiamine phosphate synthase [Hymenobacter rubripertinctus]|uniref:thiamine phosphate synthase n=1 Tax=Hymenobacter rubripertinctus TaxID=2029981 RepID=UPI001603D367|nr:thiamine phosphate synthase [Hymenobacter rubripertinctus]
MSPAGFGLLLLTPPVPHPREQTILAQLLTAPVPPARLHLRRPAWTRAQTAAWLQALPAAWLPRVVLHAHHELARELAVGGLHLPAAARASGRRPPLPRGCTLSTALHTLAEVRNLAADYDYVLLSPLFDSLSKAGYASAFELPAVTAVLREVPAASVVALGGISARTLPLIRPAGFAGAAVLGAVWQAPDPVAAWQALVAGE